MKRIVYDDVSKVLRRLHANPKALSTLRSVASRRRAEGLYSEANVITQAITLYMAHKKIQYLDLDNI